MPVYIYIYKYINTRAVALALPALVPRHRAHSHDHAPLRQAAARLQRRELVSLDPQSRKLVSLDPQQRRELVSLDPQLHYECLVLRALCFHHQYVYFRTCKASKLSKVSTSAPAFHLSPRSACICYKCQHLLHTSAYVIIRHHTSAYVSICD